jgi:hypothetical protein
MHEDMLMFKCPIFVSFPIFPNALKVLLVHQLIDASQE